MLPLIMNKKGSDNFQTPPIGLNPLLQFVPKDWIIWESACGNGNLVREMINQGYKVNSSDILTGGDYFLSEPDS